jgi:SagB-type dehydrogenase family enzyme
VSRRGGGALDYHERTKHSPVSIRSVPHFLDWDNQPIPFKIYQGVESVSLGPAPVAPERVGLGALESLDTAPIAAAGTTVGTETLSRLLFYTAGITKHLRSPGGEMAFRAAACTGALYHIEVYLVSADLDGLPAGVYHYDPRRHALDRLRPGDWRAFLSEATGEEPAVSRAAAVLVLTTTYWRNAWKYRARAYRHAFWDAGTMLANLLSMGSALSVPLRLVLGFADHSVHRLIAVDAAKESAVALVAIAGSRSEPARGLETPDDLRLSTMPLSPAEVDYPEIRGLQRDSSLSSGEDVRAWRENGPPVVGRHAGSSADLRPLGRLPPDRAAISLEQVIRRRGSSRRFSQTAVDFELFSNVLYSATRGVSADCLPAGDMTCDPYVIVNDVRGLPSGAYAFHPSAGLELLREGDLRDRARFLDLEQDLAGDASANLYLLVDLEPLLERYGSRGYRVAQLEGGIAGGKAYLASYALGLGATGLTFYDDAVTEFFSPHASGKAVMFLVAFGNPARRPVLFQR